MFYHRFCQLFGFTASLTCDKIEQILLNSLSTFYRLVWRSRQLEDKTLSSEKCFLTFYRRNNLQSAIGTGNVRLLQHGGCLQTLTANCFWVRSRGSSNHEIVLIFLNAVIISFLQIPPSKNFQIHKVLSHQLFPSPILFISSSAFFIFYLSRLHLHFFSFFTLFSVHHVLVYSFRPLRPLFPHSLLSFSLSEVTSEATIMLLAINTPPISPPVK